MFDPRRWKLSTWLWRGARLALLVERLKQLLQEGGPLDW